MRVSPLKLLILVVMSIVGLTASSIVLYLYYLLHQSLPACTLPQTFWGIRIDCDRVLGSSYNTIYGLNLDVLAVSYFIVNLALIFIVAFGSESLYGKAFKVLFAWRFVGLAIVPYLMTVEFILLKTICIYCTIMHLSILIDFGIITYFIFYKKNLRTFLAPSSKLAPPISGDLGTGSEGSGLSAFQPVPTSSGGVDHAAIAKVVPNSVRGRWSLGA
jgi:uncharacterized membrane protein